MLTENALRSMEKGTRTSGRPGAAQRGSSVRYVAVRKHAEAPLTVHWPHSWRSASRRCCSQPPLQHRLASSPQTSRIPSTSSSLVADVKLQGDGTPSSRTEVADVRSRGGHAASSSRTEVTDAKSRGGTLVKLIHVLVNKLQDRLDEIQLPNDDAHNATRAVIQSTYRLLEAIEDCHAAGHEPFVDAESRREMLLTVFSDLSILGRGFVSSDSESGAVAADERTSADGVCFEGDPWAGESVLATEQLFEWFADFLEVSRKRAAEEHRTECDLDLARQSSRSSSCCEESPCGKSKTHSGYPMCEDAWIKSDVSLGSVSTKTASTSTTSRFTGWSVSSDMSLLDAAEGSTSRSPSIDLSENVPKLPSQQPVVSASVESCQSPVSSVKSAGLQALELAFFNALEPAPLPDESEKTCSPRPWIHARLI